MNAPAPAPANADRTSRRVLWINIAVAVAFVVVVGIILLVVGQSTGRPQAAVESGTVEVVRDDSHVLGEPGSSDVVLVEFLDFECEACGAAFPFVESLREQYAGEVTFVTRYFPIPSHRNAQNAAVAAEAAAQQGKFEEMYVRLFETQAEWGEQQESKEEVFRGFAEELGLDMAQYDADVADPATLERVLSDQADGTALGVTGTPTFFLDGEKFSPSTTEEFIAAIDDALAG